MKTKENTYFLDITQFGLILTGVLVLSLVLSMGIHYTCPFCSIFHIQCPTCGMARAVKYLLAGNLYEAVRANPTVLVMPLFVWGTLRNGKIVKNDWLNGCIWSFLWTCVIVLFFIRNW